MTPLIRVDVPFHEQAIASSASGSLLIEPPAFGKWKYEDFAVVDEEPVQMWSDSRLAEVLNVDPWRELGYEGQGVKLAVFDIEWFGEEFTLELAQASTHDCFVQHCLNRRRCPGV